jgi:drug/metabolite transporter (DMT)-like permease
MAGILTIRFTGRPRRTEHRAMDASIVLPRPAPAARRERQGLWLMTAGGVLLGTLGVFLQQAGQHPLTAVWFRCAFGAAALLAWGALAGRLGELRLRGRDALAAAAAGGLMILNWALFFGAIERSSIGEATVVFHVQPLWVMLAGALWLGERVSARQWVAAGVALAGLALATGVVDGRVGGRVGAAAFSASHAAGLLMCLGGSLSYAGVTLIAKAARGASSYALACWQCLIGVAVLAWWPVLHGWPQAPAAWAWLAGMGVLHTGLAYVLLYAGMARLPAGRIALLQFVYPAAAVVVDALVYGRLLAAGQWVGVLTMAAALWALRAPRPQPQPLNARR